MLMGPNTIDSENDERNGEQEPEHDTYALSAVRTRKREGDEATDIQFMKLGQPNQRAGLDSVLLLRGRVITWKHHDQDSHTRS